MTDRPSEPDILFAGTATRDAVLANGRRLLATQPRAAVAQAREMLRADPDDRDALGLLATGLRRLGLALEALDAEQRWIAAAGGEPALVETAMALRDRRFVDAEQRVRAHLAGHPGDPAALRMLAELAIEAGARGPAEALLREALEHAPGYASARSRLVGLLVEGERVEEALALLDEGDPGAADLTPFGRKAASLGRVGDHAQAVRLYEQLLARAPDNAELWMSLGHLQNAVGDLASSVAAYRRAAAIKPGAGVVWWSLANLKAARFSEEDVAVMETQLARDDLDEEGRLHLHFALGKAYDERRDAEPAFRHYAAGNAIRHAQEGFDAVQFHERVDAAIAALPRGASGAAQRDPALGTPIFIVGMPRAGSTLIEQILSSHSQIEGTAELPVMPVLVKELEREEGASYPALTTDLGADRLAQIGDRYLEAAQVYRRSGKPFFIDKLPNNWLHAGLIARALPNALIIDARRHPLDCGWSLFRQNFARGQGFSYDLATIGHYYRDYVRFMAALDAAMPGHVHRVIHEALVEDSETQIRAMLAYLGVPFEEGVLRHHETERAVRTPSAAQVRQPINRSGMEQWRPYEAWLGPLKAALGDVLDTYPEVPSFA